MAKRRKPWLIGGGMLATVGGLVAVSACGGGGPSGSAEPSASGTQEPGYDHTFVLQGGEQLNVKLPGGENLTAAPVDLGPGRLRATQILSRAPGISASVGRGPADPRSFPSSEPGRLTVCTMTDLSQGSELLTSKSSPTDWVLLGLPFSDFDGQPGTTRLCLDKPATPDPGSRGYGF
jgi:hypothetical protein